MSTFTEATSLKNVKKDWNAFVALDNVKYPRIA